MLHRQGYRPKPHRKNRWNRPRNVRLPHHTKRQACRRGHARSCQRSHYGIRNLHRKYAERIADATGKSGVTEKIVGRWLAAAVTNAYNQTKRREMNPRPTNNTAN